MRLTDRKRPMKDDVFMAAFIAFVGVVILGISLTYIRSNERQRAEFAQSTQMPGPQQPSAADSKPADAKPEPAKDDTQRPTTPAPQPARPNPEAQKSGATPALPPAPAEKTGEPIRP